MDSILSNMYTAPFKNASCFKWKAHSQGSISSHRHSLSAHSYAQHAFHSPQNSGPPSPQFSLTSSLSILVDLFLLPLSLSPFALYFLIVSRLSSYLSGCLNFYRIPWFIHSYTLFPFIWIPDLTKDIHSLSSSFDHFFSFFSVVQQPRLNPA